MAWKNGIREFDTAQGYGNSEAMLGKAFAKLGISGKVKVISKLYPSLDHLDKSILSGSLDRSLKNLGIPFIATLLLHHEESLPLWNKGLSDILKSFVTSGRVGRIGVSVYSPAAGQKAVNTKGIDVVQVPFNIFDRRFEKAGVFKAADKKKKEIYIRSVFLQGLLLIDPDELPKSMNFAAPALRKFRSICQKLNRPPRELALAYVRTKLPQTKVIIGVEMLEQLEDNCRTWNSQLSASVVDLLENEFSEIDQKIINPTLWKK